MALNPERQRALRLTIRLVSEEPWPTVLARLVRDWEDAMNGLKIVDPTDVRAVASLQARAQAIENLITGIEDDVERYRKESQKGGDGYD